MKFDEYIVNYDETTNKPIVTKGGELEDSVTYYYGANAKEIYFNPVDGIYCTKEEYHIDNSILKYNGTDSTKTTENQTSCLKWWAYSEDSKGFNMISDHNMSDNLPWISRSEYESLGGIVLEDVPGCKYAHVCARTDKGPGDNLKNTLYNIAIDWNAILVRNDKYAINGLINDDDRIVDYTIDYTGYKARLLSAEEIASITGANKPSPKGIDWKLEDLSMTKGYYLDGSHGSDITWQTQIASSSNKSSYSWLYDYTSDPSKNSCKQYGCETDNVVIDSNNLVVRGYWTGSSKIGNNYGPPWLIGFDGNTFNNQVPPEGAYMGIRPVITVPKSIAS